MSRRKIAVKTTRAKRRSRSAAGGARRPGGHAAAARPADRNAAAGQILRARDLMTRSPITVRAETTVSELCDILQVQNVNGAPVVDALGHLLGVVTQEDIIYGTMGSAMSSRMPPLKGGGERTGKRVVAMLKDRQLRALPPASTPGSRPFWADAPRAGDPMDMPVSSIMTSPAIAAEEETPITELCRLMWSLRIHRVPILKGGKVTGLVSSMDLCRAILEGKITI